MSVVVEWNGDIFKKSMNDAMIKALIRSTNIVQADAKTIVPQPTGNLRDSIIKGVDDNKLLGAVSTKTEYAEYVEFGTKFQKAQPYLRPALNDNKNTIRKIFIQEGEKAIDK